MSVYKRPGSATYSYDFQFRGARFSGSTGVTSKREADRVEAELKRKLREQPRAQSDDAPMTFAVAWSRYWDEVGVHHANSVDTLRSLEWLAAQIGPKTPIAHITGSTMAKLVAKRRGENVSAATVNRSVGEIMRAIMIRARKVWGQQVSEIDWKKVILKEPQERVREASPDEETSILDAIRGDYAPALRFALLTGCRRAEIVSLTWTRVSFHAREFRVIGKGDKARTIPMSQEVYDLLWALKNDHPEAVFTFVARRTKRAGGREWIRGARYPITDEGFKTQWRRGPKSLATLHDFRFHDTRHTAATRLVRATGNLRLAQSLLGHTEITTTTRYAHVTNEDLRRGLQASHSAQIPTKTHTEDAVEGDTELNFKGKSG